MRDEPICVCPKCGTEIAAKPVVPQTSAEQASEREYDRRGVLLPRRTRVGGIITPQ